MAMNEQTSSNPMGNVKRRRHRKVCQFCKDKVNVIDYKDPLKMRRFVNERGKIVARRSTGTCWGHQKTLTRAIKRARNLALLPFTAE